MRWAYGITTVPSRRRTLFPRTLESLAAGGFTDPHVFVDGCRDSSLYPFRNVTLRYPAVRTAGNWVLSLYELYYRCPTAERFVIFQDDLVCYRGLRAYLDATCTQERVYWNCYTMQSNETVNRGKLGWCMSNQNGRGALALVFSLAGVQELCKAPHLAKRPTDMDRGHRCIDGGVVEAMAQAGYKEMVHMPTLVQHTGGGNSSMGNVKQWPLPESWRGEAFDVRQLLEAGA